MAWRRRPNPAELSVDEWTQERLTLWVGRSLSEVRISEVSLVLSFWEHDDNFSAWFYAEDIQVSSTGVDDGQLTLRRSSSDVLVALHALLGVSVVRIEVLGGRLRIAFEGGVEVLVEPQTHAQAWALAFEQGGSITCRPGGALDVRPPLDGDL